MSYFGNVLESGKDLLDLFFNITLGEAQEDTVVILRPTSRTALRPENSALNETVDIGRGELPACEAGIALLDQLWHIDILDGERSQLRFKDGEDLSLSDEEVMDADKPVLSGGGVAQNTDYGLAN